MNRRLIACAAAATAALALAPAASAGKASIALAQPLTGSTSSLYTSGVSYTISQDRTTEPWVRTNCTVNGVLAYSQLLGYFPSWPFGQTFYFSSNYLNWNYDRLPLYCHGLLEWIDARGAEHVMASTGFVVQP